MYVYAYTLIREYSIHVYETLVLTIIVFSSNCSYSSVLYTCYYCFTISGVIVLCVSIFRPPLRQYLMDGDFFVGAALATTLTKLALRYITLTEDKKRQNVGFNKCLVNHISVKSSNG